MPANRFAVPPTRLPFVNAEIATVTCRGTPHLVSSIWGGGGGGKLFFWDPNGERQFMRVLPDGIPGAYMLKQGPDGRLYLGCGNGSLLRYDGATDQFETLVKGELNGIAWGGVLVGERVLWNASRFGRSGAVGVYDRAAARLVHVFDPLDPGKPTALYGHRATATPEGQVLWGMNVPVGRLLLVDPQALTVRSLAPAWLGGLSWANMTFLDAQTLAVFSGPLPDRGELYVARWPSLELLARLPTPPGGTLHDTGFLLGRYLYRMDCESGSLCRLLVAGRDWAATACAPVPELWETVLPNWSRGTRTTLGVFQDRAIVGITMFGEALYYAPATGDTRQLELDANGLLGVHALCAVPERKLVVGAPFINQRFWSLDTARGAGRDEGRAAPGSGQVNQIVWDPASGRALMSSYTTATVTAWDPAQPTAWPTNPRVVGSAHGQGQMRPLTLVHDGRYVWMATSPEYGTLGGALCRVDPQGGGLQAWAHLVRDQRPVALVVDPARRRVYFATDIYADCGSCPPTQTTAQLGVFCMDTLRLLSARPLAEGVPALHLVVLLPDGRVLVQNGRALHAWDPAANTVALLGELPAAVKGLMPGPRGTVIGIAADSLGVVMFGAGGGVGGKADASAVTYTPKVAVAGAGHVHVAGDAVWYAVGNEVGSTPLSELGL